MPVTTFLHFTNCGTDGVGGRDNHGAWSHHLLDGRIQGKPAGKNSADEIAFGEEAQQMIFSANKNAAYFLFAH